MQKAEAVAALGSSSLSLPAWVRAALGANDRLKLYLSVLQAAAAVGWLLALAPWVGRIGGIYLRPRADGRPG